MNLALDEALRRAARDDDFLAAARAAPQESADRVGIPLADLTDILNGDLRALHDRGGHPLLIMQLAGALGIDPMSRLRPEAADHTPPPSNGVGAVAISLDAAKCEGFASCVISAPELFDLDVENNVAVILDPSPGAEFLAAAREAAASCPTQAIAVT